MEKDNFDRIVRGTVTEFFDRGGHGPVVASKLEQLYNRWREDQFVNSEALTSEQKDLARQKLQILKNDFTDLLLDPSGHAPRMNRLQLMALSAFLGKRELFSEIPSATPAPPAPGPKQAKARSGIRYTLALCADIFSNEEPELWQGICQGYKASLPFDRRQVENVAAPVVYRWFLDRITDGLVNEGRQTSYNSIENVMSSCVRRHREDPHAFPKCYSPAYERLIFSIAGITSKQEIAPERPEILSGTPAEKGDPFAPII